MITTENDSGREPSAAAHVALHMAQTFGWKVLPIHWINRRTECSCQKGAHCKSPGKHPLTSDGVHGASSDLNVIRAWVSHWPDANWAVACGEASGIVVIDIDLRHGGYTSIQEYEENRPDGPLPRTLPSSTGGGGRHLFSAIPADGSQLSLPADGETAEMVNPSAANRNRTTWRRAGHRGARPPLSCDSPAAEGARRW